MSLPLPPVDIVGLLSLLLLIAPHGSDFLVEELDVVALGVMPVRSSGADVGGTGVGVDVGAGGSVVMEEERKENMDEDDSLVGGAAGAGAGDGFGSVEDVEDRKPKADEVAVGAIYV